MNSRKSRILLGILLLLFGISFFILKYFQIQYQIRFGVLLGSALILLYVAKGKSWALIFGCLVLMNQGFYFLQHFFENQNICAGISLMLPGSALLWLSWKKRKSICLVPGCFIIWTGIYIILTGFPFFMSIAGALFFFCFGLGYLMVYLIGKGRCSKWIFWLGIGNLFFGCLLIRGNENAAFLSEYISIAGAAFLVVAGLTILVKAMKNR